MLSAGFEMLRHFDEIPGPSPMHPAVGILTRELAAARGSALQTLFAYEPPRLRLTMAEQQLLRAALDGSPDDALSGRLRVPLSAVKARWTSIQHRATLYVPELFLDVPPPKANMKRGAQTRHLVLDYVRANPSELTPYAYAAVVPERNK